MINIKVISDTICPWCYIGKKELEKAINKLNNIEFSISYKPFQLDPTMPVNGVDRKSYINRKFGEDTAKDVGNKIKEAGKLVGIDFNYEKIIRTPNTLNSHRILKWAERDNKQNEALELLFYSYFTEGKDIGDNEELIKESISKVSHKKIILIDRFSDSTIAYQHYGMGLNLNIIKNLNSYIIGKFKPDLTYLCCLLYTSPSPRDS